MSIRNRVPLRAIPFAFVFAMGVVAVFGPPSPGGPAQAAEAGMDAMSLDVNTAGNSAGAVGAIDQCARIQNDGVLNYDEDVVADQLIIDVVAEGVPSYDDAGTPAPGDDSGGIIGYSYKLGYPSLFTVEAQQAPDSLVHILAANNSDPADIYNASETLPDDEGSNYNSWASTMLDIGTATPESGDGVLDRLTIKADDTPPPGPAAGQYLLQLTENHHIGASGADNLPLASGLVNIAVNQACGLPLVTSLGYYHPVTPARILDTRSFPQSVPPGKVQSNATVTVDVTGVGASGVPASGVSAVVVNATVEAPTSISFLTVYPSGTNKPLASNLNFVAGQTVPNLVTVKVGADGTVKVYNAAGAVNVIFDIVGWYGGPQSSGAYFNALSPVRILDTRNGTGAPAAKVGDGGIITVDVTDTFGSGVPPSGVSAVVVNATVDAPTSTSYLTVYPSDAPKPNASNLNFVANQTVPNLVIVKVGAVDGSVKVYNDNGQTDVIFDVVGWYGTASGDVFYPLSPGRVLDTRTSPQGTPPGSVQSNAEIVVDVTGVAESAVPATGASGIVVNTTITGPTLTSYLTVYPNGVARPTASNLNFAGGKTIPNLVMVKTGGDGNVRVYNNNGQVHVIFDVVGYFGAVPLP